MGDGRWSEKLAAMTLVMTNPCLVLLLFPKVMMTTTVHFLREITIIPQIGGACSCMLRHA